MGINSVINQAQRLSDNEEFESAYELLKSSYEKNSSNAHYLEAIAIAAKTIEKVDEAQEYWERLVEVEPNSMVAYSELQEIYFSRDKFKYYLTRAKVKVLQGNVSQAVADYKKAIDNTSEEENITSTRLLLAKSYEFIGKSASAIDEYFKILDHGDDLAVYYKLAELYAIEDKHSSINILQRAVEAFPDVADLKELLSKYLIDTNQPEEALKYVQSDLNKAKIYLMTGKNDEAYEILSVSQDKTSRFNLLFAEYFFNKKDFDNCVEQIKQFKNKEPQSPLTYQMLALIDEEKNDMAKSHYNWGKCYQLKGDEQMALNEFLVGHNIAPDNINIINEIIKIYEGNKEFHALLEFYEKVLQLEPDNQMAMEKLGNFFIEMGEYSNALTYFEKLSELNPKNYKIYKNIAICYEKCRNNILAKEYYAKYFAKAPVSEENEALKKKINMLPDENMQEEEGFLNKILSFFAK